MTSRRRPLARSAGLLASVAALLVGSALPALADPARPSNYDSTIVEQPATSVDVEIQGGDSFFVMEVEPGREVLVPGYDSDDDFSDWEELEVYLRVLPDGTVQLNRNSAAYYQNAERYGSSPEGLVGPDVPPNWETVADDGRIAWHDHRIHWMSPVPPDSVDTDASGVQDVLDYRVPIIVDGQLTVAEGDLDFVPDSSPLPVFAVALLGLVGGVLLARRTRGGGAVAALVTGGVAAALLLSTSVGRPVGFEIATPPIVLAGIGALAPALGVAMPGLRETHRRGLVALGGIGLLVFGVLATGVLDPLFGGGGLEAGGFGSWWLRPTLPVDVLPEVLRLAIAAGTGVGVALLAVVTAEALAVPGGLDGVDTDPAEQQPAGPGD